jgi:cation diffusion facilitator family transporter
VAESRRTVVVALLVNLVIAVGKLIVGILGGSSAMLSEAAHSVADTTNEIFLLTSLRRSAQPPDATHPFGYGMERFFWSLLAAVGIFVSGAAFSVYQGVTGLLHPEHGESEVLLSYLVLGASFVAEGISWWTAVHQLRTESRAEGRGFFEHIRRSSDPTVKTVFSEDSAALIGLILAAAGIALHQVTGRSQWDAAAAISIGVLLAYVAFALGRDTKELLIGEAADPELRAHLWRELAAEPEVDAVVEVLTMQLGPDEVLVAARLDLADGLDSDGIERASARIDQALHQRHPEVTQVFLDATRASARERARSAERSGPPTETP